MAVVITLTDYAQRLVGSMMEIILRIILLLNVESFENVLISTVLTQCTAVPCSNSI